MPNELPLMIMNEIDDYDRYCMALFYTKSTNIVASFHLTPTFSIGQLQKMHCELHEGPLMPVWSPVFNITPQKIISLATEVVLRIEKYPSSRTLVSPPPFHLWPTS
jgi:hypothetical protein